eukprot:TRINITY_DN6061_c0_g1_i10.p1 TRINITY_DN6061_c0_g1~~TRINITY_DN6061_c0_g1_i10.p1  ORF type:complete len:250 (+),score=36.36 TRINITY_DN6061_c0_g1_i10:86-835(+)
MNKLRGYFARGNLPTDFPHFDVEEEVEIRETLGISGSRPTRDLFISTLRNCQDLDSETEHAGTVRVKHGDGREYVGTVRIKRGEEFGEITQVGIVETDSHGEEVFAEVDESSIDFGSVRITRDDVVSGTVKVIPDSCGPYAFVYRPPEPWELSIIALEKGEWTEEMNEDAFGKFRRKRIGLDSVFYETQGFEPKTDVVEKGRSTEELLSRSRSEKCKTNKVEISRSRSEKEETRAWVRYKQKQELLSPK